MSLALTLREDVFSSVAPCLSTQARAWRARSALAQRGRMDPPIGTRRWVTPPSQRHAILLLQKRPPYAELTVYSHIEHTVSQKARVYVRGAMRNLTVVRLRSGSSEKLLGEAKNHQRFLDAAGRRTTLKRRQQLRLSNNTRRGSTFGRPSSPSAPTRTHGARATVAISFGAAFGARTSSSQGFSVDARRLYTRARRGGVV